MRNSISSRSCNCRNIAIFIIFDQEWRNTVGPGFEFTLSFLDVDNFVAEKLRDWIMVERWPLLPQISAANIYSVANSSGKKLVLLVGEPAELIARSNTSTETGRFDNIKEAS